MGAHHQDESEEKKLGEVTPESQDGGVPLVTLGAGSSPALENPSFTRPSELEPAVGALVAMVAASPCGSRRHLGGGLL